MPTTSAFMEFYLTTGNTLLFSAILWFTIIGLYKRSEKTRDESVLTWFFDKLIFNVFHYCFLRNNSDCLHKETWSPKMTFV